jgi:hypothetical protein
MRKAFVVVLVVACSNTPSTDETCDLATPLAARTLATLDARQLLATVAHDDTVGLILREQRGDRHSLCPDCNDGVLECADCALDVVLYQPDVASPAVVELHRWYLGSPYDGVSAANATVDANGDIVVAWQRKLGASGLSPSAARYARIAADGTRIDPSIVLYDSEIGRLRLIAHPDRPDVLALRDYDVVLARVGTWIAVLSPDGPPAWTELGSSLGFAAGAAPFRDGFVVAYSDQYGDTATDPDCAACASLGECFPDGTIDPTMDLPSMGCLSFFDASPAGGLQVVQVMPDAVTTPVQLASGWYDRVYHGEMQTLYSDHTLTDVVATADGFSIVSQWVDDTRVVTRWLDVDFTTGVVDELEVPIDYVADGGSPWWFAQTTIDGIATTFIAASRHVTTDDESIAVRAFQRGTCVGDEQVFEGAGYLRGGHPSAGGIVFTHAARDGSTVDIIAIDSR